MVLGIVEYACFKTAEYFFVGEIGESETLN